MGDRGAAGPWSGGAGTGRCPYRRRGKRERPSKARTTATSPSMDGCICSFLTVPNGSPRSCRAGWVRRHQPAELTCRRGRPSRRDRLRGRGITTRRILVRLSAATIATRWSRPWGRKRSTAEVQHAAAQRGRTGSCGSAPRLGSPSPSRYWSGSCAGWPRQLPGLPPVRGWQDVCSALPSHVLPGLAAALIMGARSSRSSHCAPGLSGGTVGGEGRATGSVGEVVRTGSGWAEGLRQQDQSERYLRAESYGATREFGCLLQAAAAG